MATIHIAGQVCEVAEPNLPAPLARRAKALESFVDRLAEDDEYRREITGIAREQLLADEEECRRIGVNHHHPVYRECSDRALGLREGFIPLLAHLRRFGPEECHVSHGMLRAVRCQVAEAETLEAVAVTFSAMEIVADIHRHREADERFNQRKKWMLGLMRAALPWDDAPGR